MLAQIYAEQVLQRREASLLRHRRRRFASEATAGTRETVDESELTSENDYEDIELGRVGSSEWQPPSRPPRRKRSKSASDFESGSPDVEMAGRKSKRDVGTEMGRASLTHTEDVSPKDANDETTAGWSVSDRIERIQMCPLQLEHEEDVSKLSRTTDLLFGFIWFYVWF